MAQGTAADVLAYQRDGLRRRLDAHNRWGARPAAAGLLALAAAVLAFWYATDDRSTASTLLLLAGITIAAIAVLLYFLSPSPFLRGEVADAIAVAGVTDLGKVLSSLLIEGRGVYVPASEGGATKVFVPVAEAPREIPSAGSVFVSRGSKGVLLDPPGYGLLALARQISPAFTDQGLGSEIADVMENGLELARRVTVRREGDKVAVSMAGLANAGLCAAIRKESPGLCTQIGCPICSFAACMIADGTRRRVRIEGTEAEGTAVRATFRLL